MKPTTSRDPWLRRFEKDTVLACLAMAGAGLMVRKGNPDVAFGVLGGGLLGAFSYWAIKGGVDAMLGSVAGGGSGKPSAEPAVASGVRGAASGEDPGGESPLTMDTRRERRRPPLRARVLAIAKFIGRYALLGVAAYVMLAILRLHPVGMLVGVSAPVVAAAVLVVRIAPRRS